MVRFYFSYYFEASNDVPLHIPSSEILQGGGRFFTSIVLENSTCPTVMCSQL